MYYVKKQDLVQVDRGEDGQFIVSSEFDTQQVITEDEFYKDYIGVRKLRKIRQKSMSPFEQAYIEQLANFQLESNEENQDYIEGTRSLLSNKPF